MKIILVGGLAVTADQHVKPRREKVPPVFSASLGRGQSARGQSARNGNRERFHSEQGRDRFQGRQVRQGVQQRTLPLDV